MAKKITGYKVNTQKRKVRRSMKKNTNSDGNNQIYLYTKKGLAARLRYVSYIDENGDFVPYHKIAWRPLKAPKGKAPILNERNRLASVMCPAEDDIQFMGPQLKQWIWEKHYAEQNLKNGRGNAAELTAKIEELTNNIQEIPTEMKFWKLKNELIIKQLLLKQEIQEITTKIELATGADKIELENQLERLTAKKDMYYTTLYGKYITNSEGKNESVAEGILPIEKVCVMLEVLENNQNPDLVGKFVIAQFHQKAVKDNLILDRIEPSEEIKPTFTSFNKIDKAYRYDVVLEYLCAIKADSEEPIIDNVIKDAIKAKPKVFKGLTYEDLSNYLEDPTVETSVEINDSMIVQLGKIALQHEDVPQSYEDINERGEVPMFSDILNEYKAENLFDLVDGKILELEITENNGGYANYDGCKNVESEGWEIDGETIILEYDENGEITDKDDYQKVINYIKENQVNLVKLSQPKKWSDQDILNVEKYLSQYLDEPELISVRGDVNSTDIESKQLIEELNTPISNEVDTTEVNTDDVDNVFGIVDDVDSDDSDDLGEFMDDEEFAQDIE